MTKENTDKLRIAAVNGLKFELQASQSNFADYNKMIEIIGSHFKSKIEVCTYY
jgi:hypothetical protein